MHKSRFFFVVSTIACASLVSFCGDDPQYADITADAGDPDSGIGDLECFGPGDCLTGDCVAGKCVHCRDFQCPTGTSCGVDGKCTAGDGGTIANPDDGGVGGCLTREDCQAGEVCKGSNPQNQVRGTCGAPDTSGGCTTNDECLNGFICRFGTCKAGCETNADCAGNTDGPRCYPGTETCGPCLDSGDCSNGDLCVSGACVAPNACTDRSTCGDLACINNKCAPCTSPADCGANADCTSGKCTQVGGCTSDSECKIFSAGHWCNPASKQCEYGCLPGTGSACGSNCCGTGLVCNTTTHGCESTQNPCNNCNNSCTGSQTCNTSTCQCEGGGTNLPGPFEACTSACECDTGLTCICAFAECEPLQCTFGLGFCL